VLAVAGAPARIQTKAMLADDVATLGEHHPYTRHTQNLLTSAGAGWPARTRDMCGCSAFLWVPRLLRDLVG
jgi:hypothetical protein